MLTAVIVMVAGLSVSLNATPRAYSAPRIVAAPSPAPEAAPQPEQHAIAPSHEPNFPRLCDAGVTQEVEPAAATETRPRAPYLDVGPPYRARDRPV